MAGKTFYSCVCTINGTKIARLKELNIEANMDTHESSDLGSDWATTERGVKRWSATCRTEFGGANLPMISQLHAHDSQVLVRFKDRDVAAASATVFWAGSAWIVRATMGGGEGIGMGDLAFTGHGAPSTVA